MEIVVSSKSWKSDLSAWIVTRMLRPRVLLLAILLIAAACLSHPVSVADGSWIWNAVAIVGLVFTFRLQDDLADTETDRHRRPDRILCRSAFTKQLLLASQCFRLVAGAAILLRFGGWSLMTFSVLILILNAWYQDSFRLRHPIGNAAVVLLKYPCFLIITVWNSGWPAFAVATGVYLLLFTIEWRAIHSESNQNANTTSDQ